MIDGLAVVDKPAGWTSHDIVAKCRGIFGQRRIGHSGTLDPDATGVLLVGLGRVTRLLRFLTDLRKTYGGEVVFGVETSTLDASGEVTARHDMAVSLDSVAAAASSLTGRIKQVPPMVSAVKVGGRRLHELAREGVEVERAPREVEVFRFDVAATADPLVFAVEVECSSGTYIRTLAADLGAALGGGAHLRNLRRTAIGSFTLADAHALESLSAESVLSPAEAVRDYPSLVLDPAAVANGKVLEMELGGPTAVLDGEGRLLAVYEPHPTKAGLAKPAVVVAQ